MNKITPRDIIAGLALVICALLLFSGKDGEIKALMGVIIGYYFAFAQVAVKNKINHEKPKPPSNV